MKRLIAAVLLLASPASQAAEVRWEGGFLVVGSEGACGQLPPNYNAVARFQAPVTAENGPGSRLSLFEANVAHNFSLASGKFDSTPKLVEATIIDDHSGEYGSGSGVTVEFTKTNPTSISKNTDFIEVTGEVKGFRKLANCTVRFRMTLQQIPRLTRQTDNHRKGAFGMRTLIASLVSACLSISSAGAVEHWWEGQFVIKGKQGTCSFYDPVGFSAYSRFAAALPGSNSRAALALFNQDSARAFQLSSGNFSNVFKTVETVNVWSHFAPFDQTVSIKFTSQAPSSIVKGTKFIKITGEIKNWDRQAGCRVTFGLALTKRP